MKIIVENDEERGLITALCDVALKSGGLSNYTGIGQILSAVETTKPKKETRDGKKRNDDKVD